MSNKFNRLIVPEGYRHFWSKYPEGYTILEALLSWVDSVNQLTDNVNDWNEYLVDFVETFDENLQSTVITVLREMEDDGTLATIINEHIFEELNNKVDTKADKTYVDGEFEDINRQLEDKADKNDMDMKLSNKRDKSTKIGTGDLTQEVKESMTGGSVAVVGEDAVGTINLQDGAVTTNKTSYLNPTYNLFNPKTATVGKTINSDTGEISDSNTHTISDFIDVKQNTNYYVNNTCGVRRYRENGEFISGAVNDTGVFDSRTADKIRLSILNSGVYDFMLVEGDSLPSYIEHGFNSEVENSQYQLKTQVKKEVINAASYNVETENIPHETIDIIKNATSVLSNNLVVLMDDYQVRWRDRPQSIKIDVLSSPATIRFPMTQTLDLTGITEFLTVIYIEDVSKVDNIVVGITGLPWERAPYNDLKNGWNILRHQVSAGDVSTWNTADEVRLHIYSNANTTVYLSDFLAIKPQKAKILFINDHGYSNFKNVAYPQLKALGIPTTWAINPGRLGANIGSVESILTQNEIDDLSFDPYSEFSYHAWDPTEHHSGNMTAEELLEEHQKCTTYLKKHGLLPNYYWRAAFTTNEAPEHAVLQPYLDAYATYRSSGGTELYPFRNRYNVNRDALHGTSRTEERFDATFDMLKKTRSLYVCYTHGLDDAGGIHMTNSQLDYFLSKIEEGVNEGWLEGTTYSKLRGQYRFDDYADIL